MPAKKSLITLTDEHKSYIVVQWAMWRSAAQIIEQFGEVFGMEITYKHVAQYNLDGWYGSRTDRAAPLSKWRTLFDETRAKFLSEITAIPISNEAYRLKTLQHLLDKQIATDNASGAMALLKQAAEEVGRVYTNKREIEVTPLALVSEAEKRALIADVIKAGIDRIEADKLVDG